MKHLTDEQLSARLDGELAAKQAEAAERHLAECADCRERLAALTGSDASLARALDHDPGERYFETFADRVQARIAAGAPRAEAAPARAGWLSRPATLAWAGSVAALVVVGAFALQFASQQSAGTRRAIGAPPVAGADRVAERDESAPPAEAEGQTSREAAQAQGAPPAYGGAQAREQALATPASPPAEDGATQEEARREGSGNAPRPPATTAPQRLQEVRTLPNGEQVPVTPRALPPALAKSKSFAPPPTEEGKLRKPAAAPMAPAPTPAPAAEKSLQAAPAPAPTSASLLQANEASGGLARADAGEAATFRLCGTVRNAQGRTVAGATVTVAETGRSTVSGPGGEFCVDAPSPGATLTVLSLGYQEFRAAVRDDDAATPYAVSLKSVDALGSGGLAAGRLKAEPPPGESVKTLGDADKRSPEAGMYSYSRAFSTPAAPAPAGESPEVAAARAATDAALRARTVTTWARAGSLWVNVAAGATSGPLVNEALYRAAEARVSAWRLARGAADLRAATDAVDAFLARAPAGAERRRAEGWRKELASR